MCIILSHSNGYQERLDYLEHLDDYLEHFKKCDLECLDYLEYLEKRFQERLEDLERLQKWIVDIQILLAPITPTFLDIASIDCLELYVSTRCPGRGMCGDYSYKILGVTIAICSRTLHLDLAGEITADTFKEYRLKLESIADLLEELQLFAAFIADFSKVIRESFEEISRIACTTFEEDRRSRASPSGSHVASQFGDGPVRLLDTRAHNSNDDQGNLLSNAVSYLHEESRDYEERTTCSLGRNSRRPSPTRSKRRVNPRTDRIVA